MLKCRKPSRKKTENEEKERGEGGEERGGEGRARQFHDGDVMYVSDWQNLIPTWSSEKACTNERGTTQPRDLVG